MQTIRLGIIGAGGIVKARHLPGLKKLRGVELVAVCNRSRESGAKVAAEWGIQRVATSPREIIEAADIDAVLIGTWPYLHQSLACAALAAGKHVFTQARMARNLAEAKIMEAAARRYPQLVAMICPSPFAMKPALFVKQLLERGYVGKVRLAQFWCLTAGLADAGAPLSWRQSRRLNGLNTLALGIHLERFLQWFGPIDSVEAVSSIFTPRRRDETGRLRRVDNADQIQVIAQLREHPGQLNMIFSGVTRFAPKDCLYIYGEKGTLRVDYATDEVFGAQAGDKELVKLPVPASLACEWRVEADFIDAIRAGGVKKLPAKRTRFFPPDFAEGVRYMAVTEACIRAATTHRRVGVRY
jgi:predicted dehydrogenase